jgi:hypothetical protein
MRHDVLERNATRSALAFSIAASWTIIRGLGSREAIQAMPPHIRLLPIDEQVCTAAGRAAARSSKTNQNL